MMEVALALPQLFRNGVEVAFWVPPHFRILIFIPIKMSQRYSHCDEPLKPYSFINVSIPTHRLSPSS